jgi:hypothetical protein
MSDWMGSYDPKSSDGVDARGLPTLALSLREPWLWAVLHFGKHIENRKWHTSYRGPVLLHASKTCSVHECDEFLAFVHERFGIETMKKAAARLGMPLDGGRYKLGPPLLFGGIAGVCTMKDVLPVKPTLFDPPMPKDGELDLRWRIGGQCGFVLGSVSPLPFVPCKGALGFFALPPEVLARVHESILDNRSVYESILAHRHG